MPRIAHTVNTIDAITHQASPAYDVSVAERLFGPMRLDLLREQKGRQGEASHTEAQRTDARLQAQITEADRAIALQVRALEAGIEPDLVRARIDELKAEKAAAHAALPKLGLAPGRQEDPTAILGDLPDLTERLRNADEATSAPSSTPSTCASSTTRQAKALDQRHADRGRSRSAPHRPVAVVRACTPGAGFEPATVTLTGSRAANCATPDRATPDRG
jgi:hypothetical protein